MNETGYIAVIALLGAGLAGTAAMAVYLAWQHRRQAPARALSGQSCEEATETIAALRIELHAAQKLERLGQLAAGIAHDFNTFLTTIRANCQVARMDLPDNHPATESLDQISKATHRAAAMVREILVFARNQGQERHLVSLESVASDAVNLLRPMLPANVVLTTRFVTDCPGVMANVQQLEQALLNLGTNAAHAMRQAGGRLEISVEPSLAEEDAANPDPNLATGAYARLTVRDSGQGMDAATRERIFEPFFTTKSGGEGTGLGLFIVQGIMTNHGGVITVHSEPGKGTVFHLYFPAASPAGPQGEPQVAGLPRGQGEHILLVDTAPSTAEAGQRLLQALGYQVSLCGRASDAVALLVPASVRPVDCILCELVLPGVGGLELAAECRERKLGVPFILMSSDACALTTDALRAMGVFEFMTKPFPPASLAEAVHRALNSARS